MQHLREPVWLAFGNKGTITLGYKDSIVLKGLYIK